METTINTPRTRRKRITKGTLTMSTNNACNNTIRFFNRMNIAIVKNYNPINYNVTAVAFINR